MPDDRMLEIVDEDGNVTGRETRERIHREGLLHKEIRVWFYTPDGEIIFQHRAKDKETFPDLLDATVGGHVEIGYDYPDTVIEEIREETGVEPDPAALSLIGVVRSESRDEVTGTTNNVLRAIYTYRYDGAVSDLKIEEGKGLGFESRPIERLLDLSESERKRFIPGILGNETQEIFLELASRLREFTGMTYESPESHIHFIARALLRQGEDAILCRLKSKDWNFLPGGHVEDGESARSALARELVEELGEGDYQIGDLVGVCENVFPISKTSGQHEVNFVFEVRVPTGISFGSREEHLEFVVVPADSLCEHRILPDSLKTGILSFLETGKSFHETSDSL